MSIPLEVEYRITDALGFPRLAEDDAIRDHVSNINKGVAVSDDPKPDPIAMGDKDVRNVLYINFTPKGLTGKEKEALDKMHKRLELNANWLSLKAGVETSKRMTKGELPGDMSVSSQMKRNSYRAKVINYLMQNSSWMAGTTFKGIERVFSVKKAEFHAELLRNFLEGMMLNPSVYNALEGILKMISASIVASKETTEKSMFWLLTTVHVWDEQLQDIRSSSNEVKKVVVGKAQMEYINMRMGYTQTDASFNPDVWDGDIEKAVKEYLRSMGVKIINEPLDIPVD